MTTTVASQIDVAGQVLDLVRAVAGGQAEAEVAVDRQDLALTRFANSYIHQNVADSTTTVRLRLHLDGRTTSGATTLTDTHALRELVQRTVDACRVCPPDPGWPGLAPPAPLVGTGNVDEATANASPADRAMRVRAFVDAAGGLLTAGYCKTVHWTGAFANSAGQSVSGGCTAAAMDGIARTGTSDGVSRLAAVRLADLDGAVLGARAAAKARAAQDPVELPPGRYEVVLEPTAVADVLQCLAMYGFNGKAVNERRSFVAFGEQQFDPSVTLVDDPLSADAVGLPFDPEGTPKRRLVLVDRGVTRTVAYDRRTAAEAGTESNGHAMADSAPWGTFPTSIGFVTSGGAKPTEVEGPATDSATAALVANVKRGLLVSDNWYTRVLDPRTLVMTGLTRNGVWLIENGEVTRPVLNFRFTQSYPQALAPGAVLGIGSHPLTQPSSWGLACTMAPALHLASWNYTGGASG
ncbi:MAG TPA: TldD/PmbA family protein [Micromonosporaceae bacterium]